MSLKVKYQTGGLTKTGTKEENHSYYLANLTDGQAITEK